jgi:hypothetical protein
MEQDKQAAHQKDKLKRKNLMVGWIMGILVIALYAFVIFFK